MSKKFHTVYDHAQHTCFGFGPSMTDQQYKDECDINSILKRYSLTGSTPVSRSSVSGDFSSIGDFQSCLERINKAKCEFEALPSDIRSRFGNDPTAYVDFVLNPANVEECVRLGLRVKAEQAEETEVDVLKRIEKAVTPKGGEPV